MKKFTIFYQYLALSRKWYKIEPELLWNVDRKPHTSFRMVLVSMILTTSGPHFKVTPLFDTEYLNEILMGSYTLSTQRCHFESPWLILSHLAKFSTTRNIARHLCDNRFSCNTNTCSAPEHVTHVRVNYHITHQHIVCTLISNLKLVSGLI